MRANRNLNVESLEERKVFTTLSGMDAAPETAEPEQIVQYAWDFESDGTFCVSMGGDNDAPSLEANQAELENVDEPEFTSRVTASNEEAAARVDRFMADLGSENSFMKAYSSDYFFDGHRPYCEPPLAPSPPPTIAPFAS